MKTFPMFLTMAGRRVVIVGGGEQAAQKCRLMLKTQAQIHVVSPCLDDELRQLNDEGKIFWQQGPISKHNFIDSILVFIATGCPGADRAIYDIAKGAGALVNVVDQPDLCDAMTPSIVDRNPVVVAIGTEGTAPVLARQIKTRLEEILEPNLGDLAALAGRMRDAAAKRLQPQARRELWSWVFKGPVRRKFTKGAEREAASLLKETITAGKIPNAKSGSVSLVGAGVGAKDLITMRGVQRLQEADIIFYDRLINEQVLEYARRDAERVFVGKTPGCHTFRQETISQLLVSAAKQGKQVVRLKCGDPSIFARSAEEIDALKSAGLDYEIVPGITAASACAAAAGDVLTERGRTDTLVITTGQNANSGKPKELAKILRKGSKVIFYMAAKTASEIVTRLEAEGLTNAVEIIVRQLDSNGQVKEICCHPSRLNQELAAKSLENPIIIEIQPSKKFMSSRPNKSASRELPEVA